MHYISTRTDSSKPAPTKNFLDILLGGLASDGGLYLPNAYPQITDQELNNWRNASYADLAFDILRFPHLRQATPLIKCPEAQKTSSPQSHLHGTMETGFMPFDFPIPITVRLPNFCPIIDPSRQFLWPPAFLPVFSGGSFFGF
jgi:hypothetical protein